MLIKRKLQITGFTVIVLILLGMGAQYITLNSVVSMNDGTQRLANVELNMSRLVRYEKEFFASNVASHVDAHKQTVAVLNADFAELRDKYFTAVEESQRIVVAINALTAYAKLFYELAETQKSVGLGRESGLIVELHASAHKAEALIGEQKSETMLRHLLALRRYEETYLLRRVETNVREFEAAYAEFMKSLGTRSWPKSARQQVAESMAAYRQFFLKIVESEQLGGAKDTDGKNVALNAAMHEAETVIDELDSALDARTQRRIRTAQFTQIVMSIAVLALIVVALAMIYKRLVSSLDKLLRGMLDASKNKDLSIRIAVSGVDEFAQTAQAFNQMSAEYEGIMQRLLKSSLGLSGTASELVAITERTNQGVGKQHHESDQVATAMNEMAATVQEVARHAAEAATASSAASDHARQGKDVVTRASNGLRTLADEVKNTANAISQVEKESANIGTVLSVIQGIAEQTNLLALNAAIEAARAGESGRGFAVVADEVRTLAQRSKESTEEIKAIIERLQAVARTAVQAMDAGLKQSAIAVEQADAAGASLEQIADAVIKINDMNSQIATAAEEQSAVAETVNASVTTIAGISDETAQMARETLVSGNKLATLAMELHQAISVFKLQAALDLSKAKSAHLAWKAKLRSFLDGKQSLTLQEAVSHKHCILGKWYYSEGLQKFGHIKAMQDVEAPHAEMHGLIKTIIELKEKGNNIEAEKVYEKVGPLSERIVGLLTDVERAAVAMEGAAINAA